jgi:nucleotide-binding universal stress UspA family protein
VSTQRRFAANYAPEMGAAPDCRALVRPDHEERKQIQLREATMKKILIATDGSASSAEAVDFGIELATEHEAKVIFVHVAPELEIVPVASFGMAGAIPRIPHHLDSVDRAPLEDAEQVAAREGVEATSKLLVGDTVDEIVAYADSEGVDLIVIGSRGHGTLASMLLGSVSRGVLSESKRPVAIIRALAAMPMPTT